MEDKGDTMDAKDVDTIIGRAAKAFKNGELPSHDAFAVSEIVAASLGMRKGYVLEEMLKKKA